MRLLREVGAAARTLWRWPAETVAALRVPFASVSFRLALNYGLFSILTMLVLIAVFYVQTVGVIRQANIRQITAMSQRLLAIDNRAGVDGLATVIDRAIADGVDTDTELLLLLDPSGRIIAGNLGAVPSVALSSSSQVVESPILHNARSTRGQLMVSSLADGSRLVVGREMSEQLRFTNLVKDATIAAAAITLLLVVGAAFWFRESLERRVELIRLTTRRVGIGDLKQRVPLTGESDEFARLDHDINLMLDRIEALMEGVRHVSNTIAHEMRTPITRALSRLRTADGSARTLDELRQTNRVVMRELEAQAQLLDKLLQIAEAESGTRRQVFQPTDIGAIAADVVDLFGTLADERGVRLDFDSGRMAPLGTGLVPPGEADSAPRVDADRDLIAGCISNLVVNAINHAGRGAQVRVGIAADDDYLTLTVVDDGPGVPAAALPQLGNRFYRANPDVPGVGLGLATVCAIVSLHDGQVVFEDAGPGLRVRLRLPIPTSA